MDGRFLTGWIADGFVLVVDWVAPHFYSLCDSQAVSKLDQLILFLFSIVPF